MALQSHRLEVNKNTSLIVKNRTLSGSMAESRHILCFFYSESKKLQLKQAKTADKRDKNEYGYIR